MTGGGGQAYKPAPLETLEVVMTVFRDKIEEAVVNRTYNGKKAKTGASALNSLIRSQTLIKGVHTHVADLFYDSGLVAPERIQFERKLPTPFDGKDEDVVLIPEGRDQSLGEEVIAIGVRSQIKSVGKNLKNNFSGTRNDATDFHEQFPAQVVGHVQILVVNEVDVDAAETSSLVWTKAPYLARTISWYAKISGRPAADAPHQFTERVALVIVDFAPETPKVYRTVKELVEDKWVTQAEADQYGLDLDSLLLDDCFILELLAAHEQRFPAAKLT